MKEKVIVAARHTEEPVDLMIVFSHPNKEDLEAKKFATAGFITDEVFNALEHAGIDPKKVYFTGMVKHGIGSKPKPSAEDIEEFREQLDKEIADFKPRLIMALGAEVFKGLCSRTLKWETIQVKSLTAPMVNY